MSRVFSLLGAFALGFGLALPAVAEPRPVVVEGVSVAKAPDPQLRSLVVKLADLDLRSGAGAAVAVRRISVAARTVCDEYADQTRGIRARTAQTQCRQDAMDSAVTRLDAPRVSEAYFGPRAHVIASAATTAAPGK